MRVLDGRSVVHVMVAVVPVRFATVMFVITGAIAVVNVKSADVVPPPLVPDNTRKWYVVLAVRMLLSWIECVSVADGLYVEEVPYCVLRPHSTCVDAGTSVFQLIVAD